MGARRLNQCRNVSLGEKTLLLPPLEVVVAVAVVVAAEILLLAVIGVIFLHFAVGILNCLVRGVPRGNLVEKTLVSAARITVAGKGQRARGIVPAIDREFYRGKWGFGNAAACQAAASCQAASGPELLQPAGPELLAQNC
jgi:hypothetical protein